MLGLIKVKTSRKGVTCLSIEDQTELRLKARTNCQAPEWEGCSVAVTQAPERFPNRTLGWLQSREQVSLLRHFSEPPVDGV